MRQHSTVFYQFTSTNSEPMYNARQQINTVKIFISHSEVVILPRPHCIKNMIQIT